MKTKKEIKALVRNTESSIEFERGRYNVLFNQGKDVEGTKATSSTISRLEAIRDAYKTVLNILL